MSANLFGWAYRQKTESAITKALLIKLCDNANDTGYAFPSMEHLVAFMELSERSIRDHIGKLEQLGLLKVIREKVSDKVNLPNKYMIQIDATSTLGEIPDPRRGTASAATPPQSVQEGTARAAGRVLQDVQREPSSKNPQKNPQRAAALPGFDLPQWLDRSTWESFVASRKAMKKPMTEQAKTNMIAELGRLRAAGHNVTDVLNTSIRAGWSDVYPPKPGDKRNGFAPAPSSTVPISDWVLMLGKFHQGYSYRDENGIERSEPVGTWDHKLGPKPGQPGCRVPPEAFEAFDQLCRRRAAGREASRPAPASRAPTPASQIASAGPS